MLGELTKGGCSMYGAWGDAVANTNSNLWQLRALDWDVDGPFRVCPLLQSLDGNRCAAGLPADHGVPHDAQQRQRPALCQHWLDRMARLHHRHAQPAARTRVSRRAGMSSVQMAISEIGASFPDDTFGKESRKGTPFTYLLRDVLQFDGVSPLPYMGDG